MRNNIIHPGADELTYEIREIVKVGNQIAKTGVDIIWENIGDPVAKGEKVPEWIKDIVADTVKNDNLSYGYSPTAGLLETREYIAKERNLEGGAQIIPDDILFFNGLGDAIATIYNYLNREARVLGPNPAYSTHSSAEAAHAGSRHITYNLNPDNNWYPDIKDMREKIIKHPEISAILIVNPDNPTGMVYSQDVIKQVVDIAKEFDLFIISDEIYSNLFYGGSVHNKLASVIGDTPGMALRGISKEFPWPGARCGWVEFYNRDKDEKFARYAKTIMDAKMMEVCATTLPQKVLPKVMGDDRYYPYLAQRTAKYWEKSQAAYAVFSKIPQLKVNLTKGAFYMTVVFKDGVLKDGQFLKPLNEKAAEIIKPLLKTELLDKQFAYHLLASRGICVVPLSSGFNSDLYGFRITLLETDMNKFKLIINTIADAIKEYIFSK
ncbi:MAG TPA: pyridoxal phosphate-dependent aminotransferase [Candidatus Goldiibacteriota bacterium]|nr:pyridoxal phosphate-dependent aminotransferase [Candidatus Goldiibacteriota bacterium]HRQ44312.1 pyridoxal phosphate-dependent aminotransferase [Candidatus Goldiibacteriota bacterium]